MLLFIGMCHIYLCLASPEIAVVFLVERGRNKTRGRPWPRPWGRPWPTGG